MKMQLKVTYEDGTTEEVAAGQRELAAWEMADMGSTNDKPILFLFFAAHSVLKKTGRLPVVNSGTKGTGAARPLAFEAWMDTVDEIEDIDTEDAPDPTTQSQPQAD
jgi:hypothetical protein